MPLKALVTTPLIAAKVKLPSVKRYNGDKLKLKGFLI
jgi:hypothetical protein